MKIFVVTNTEKGWDCVEGVYKAKSEEQVIEFLGDDYDERCHIIHEETITKIN